MVANSTQKSTAFYKNNFDADAWFKIVEKDYHSLIEKYDIEKFLNSYEGDISLLDIGCGTGKFPEILGDREQVYNYIYYDMLDPNPYCLKQTTQKLSSPPYIRGKTIKKTAEQLVSCSSVSANYDVIWAIQSLYYLERSMITETLLHLLSLLNSETGCLIIFIASKDSSYFDIDSMNTVLFPENTHNPYTFSEDIVDVFETYEIAYHYEEVKTLHHVPAGHRALLENYLSQNLLQYAPLHLWHETPEAKDWLSLRCDGEYYIFPQVIPFIKVYPSESVLNLGMVSEPS